MTTERTETHVAVDMRDISKSFGPVQALVDATLRVRSGTIHGLVGQNGAGKSTIIKVLAGIYRRDSGSVIINDERVEQITPARMERLGLHFIHQDRLLVPTATAAEAIFLRHEPRIGPFLDRRAMNRQARDLLKCYFDVDLSPNALVRDLTAAQQKIVQITRALAQQARILILDEPTAALNKTEVDSLFAVLRRLRDEGISIIFISHYMQEIEEICDTVTVMRNGTDVGDLVPRQARIEDIVALMTNRDVNEMYPRRIPSLGAAMLEAEKLTLSGAFADVSFTVHAGEIVGLTGLLGSGHKQLLECLFGLTRPDAGAIRIEGRDRRIDTPADAVRNEVALIPEDRRAHGVALGLPVDENISLASLPRYSKAGFLSGRAEREGVERLIQDLAILTPDHRTPVRNLSGGNQQKVAVAKWLSCRSKVYLLDEPTVAVDVGAKVEIYNLLNTLAGEGAGILFNSSDLEELVEMCDRIMVIYRGRLTHVFTRGEVDSNSLMTAASGAAGADARATS